MRSSADRNWLPGKLRQRRAAVKGFTLIEVLVALAVISFSLLAVSASISQMVDTANAMRERTYASWIAQNKITELRLSGTTPEVSSSSGDVDYAGVEWTWRAVISESGIENLFRVDVSVSYVGSDDAIRQVTGFIGEPVAPNQANGVWNTPLQGSGVTQ